MSWIPYLVFISGETIVTIFALGASTGVRVWFAGADSILFLTDITSVDGSKEIAVTLCKETTKIQE